MFSQTLLFQVLMCFVFVSAQFNFDNIIYPRRNFGHSVSGNIKVMDMKGSENAVSGHVVSGNINVDKADPGSTYGHKVSGNVGSNNGAPSGNNVVAGHVVKGNIYVNNNGSYNNHIGHRVSGNVYNDNTSGDNNVVYGHDVSGDIIVTGNGNSENDLGHRVSGKISYGNNRPFVYSKRSVDQGDKVVNVGVTSTNKAAGSNNIVQGNTVTGTVQGCDSQNPPHDVHGNTSLNINTENGVEATASNNLVTGHNVSGNVLGTGCVNKNIGHHVQGDVEMNIAGGSGASNNVVAGHTVTGDITVNNQGSPSAAEITEQVTAEDNNAVNNVIPLRVTELIEQARRLYNQYHPARKTTGRSTE